MSRIGNRILLIPQGVNVDVKDNQIDVSGKLGSLKINFDNKKLTILNKDSNLIIKRNNEQKTTKMLHGTINAIIKNALDGVNVGHTKKLKIVGVGYKAAVNGKNLDLNLGYSHPIKIQIPGGITVKCPQATEIVIQGANKSEVGQLAAVIRSKRKPEPYKGKGVMYSDEIIIRKVGKTAEGSKK